MNEQKNNGRGIFYGVIGVATLVVAIIGATFAYFTASASNENAIQLYEKIHHAGYNVEDYLQDGVITDMAQANDEEFFAITVPENCVFAMGDNRTGSTDCRSFGCIPLEKIEGTVAFRFWPFSKFGGVD